MAQKLSKQNSFDDNALFYLTSLAVVQEDVSKGSQYAYRPSEIFQ